MVIGNGMVAKKFAEYSDNDLFIIFASGVSNSKNINDEAYEREVTLLKEVINKNSQKCLVYFSTCSLYDESENNSRYVLHKKAMEDVIRLNMKNYFIFRISNLAGSSENRNTILNFFVYHILNRINFDMWTNATRNLIDIDHMYTIVDYILQNRLFQNQIINIASPLNHKVSEIIASIETFSNMKANFISINKGCPFIIDISMITPIIQMLQIKFEKDYLENLLKKYYHF